jgi:hypothetical protein
MHGAILGAGTVPAPGLAVADDGSLTIAIQFDQPDDRQI